MGGCCVGLWEAQGLDWAWRQFVAVAVAVAAAVAVGAQFQSVCFTFLHIDSTASRQKDERGRVGEEEMGEKLSLWLSAFCILTGRQFNIYLLFILRAAHKCANSCAANFKCERN